MSIQLAVALAHADLPEREQLNIQIAACQDSIQMLRSIAWDAHATHTMAPRIVSHKLRSKQNLLAALIQRRTELDIKDAVEV